MHRISKWAWSPIAATLVALAPQAVASGHGHGSHGPQGPQGPQGGQTCQGNGLFERVATFPVYRNTDVNNETVAEIIAATTDGNTVIYSDAALGGIGFCDITNPSDPQPAGFVALGGEPTSVAVHQGWALACVNTSADYVNTSGELVVVDVATHAIVHTIALGGQPDSIAISPDGHYAAICIENERDEDLGSGEPPQMPAGFLVIVDLLGNDPLGWTVRTVDLTGICDVFPEDPEPEFVTINDWGIAAITMQENNHVALVRLSDGVVVGDFSCGTVDLTDVDTSKDGVIRQVDSLTDVPREPDAIVWISNVSLATADEGDLYGGSRGFTTWTYDGHTLYEAGNTVDHECARLGHYPESRSGKKGNETEGLAFGRYGHDSFLFVGSERASVVLVYQLPGGGFFGGAHPILRQVLPTGIGPEGLLAIPQRGLFVASGENDARGDGYRATLSIFERTGNPNYPTIASREVHHGAPIAWAALSGLAADPQRDDVVYTIQDSYYQESRLFEVKLADHGPALITRERPLVDSNGVLLTALQGLAAALPASATADFDVSALVNADGTVNLDPEGIAVDGNGRFWIASEGAGNLTNGVSDPGNRPFESPNLLLRAKKVGQIARIEEVVLLPQEVIENQLRFGFEGVSAVGDYVYVAFQREWSAAGDPAGHVRLGRYDRTNGTWGFAFYSLDAVASPNGGWVGLSDLSYVGDDVFAVLERDNQAGDDAAVKRIYTVSVAGVTFRDASQVGSFDVLAKTLKLDILAAGTFDVTGGPMPEKLEGLAVLANGDALIVNDNDGVEDNSGETQLLELDGLFQ
ncbi:MAG: esterase-like activity of phytase family protein [Planctomycetes bacterium]|nr:esterase-like activity of phytase family protein [Planctomycetota bacterium]